MGKITRVRTGCWTCKKRYVRICKASMCLAALLTLILQGTENAMKLNQSATTAKRQVANAKGMGYDFHLTSFNKEGSRKEEECIGSSGE